MLPLLLFCLLFAGSFQSLFAATSYSISPLVDAAKPEQFFLFGFAGPGNLPVNQTPYLAGFSGGQPAAGKLDQGTFSFNTLSPLPGADGARLIGVLKDGSAVGTSYVLMPPLFPFQPPMEVPTLVRWDNGVPTELPLASLGGEGAVFTPGVWAVNGEGDLVGQIVQNGVTSLFRYNVLDGDFEVIDVEIEGAMQVIPWGINDNGQILADINGPTSLRRLYDPATGQWSTIPVPPGAFPNGIPLLNSAGVVAQTLNVNGVDRVFEFSNGVLTPLTPDALPGQGPAIQLLGYNAQGLLVMSQFATLGTFENGQFLALTPRLTNPAGWLDLTLFSGYLVGANDDGQIFGIGNYFGQPTAFVLTPESTAPVPEPASFVLVGGVVLAAVLRMRRPASRPRTF